MKYFFALLLLTSCARVNMQEPQRIKVGNFYIHKLESPDQMLICTDGDGCILFTKNEMTTLSTSTDIILKKLKDQK